MRLFSVRERHLLQAIIVSSAPLSANRASMSLSFLSVSVSVFGLGERVHNVNDEECLCVLSAGGCV